MKTNVSTNEIQIYYLYGQFYLNIDLIQTF